jgi:hypothetical protein
MTCPDPINQYPNRKTAMAPMTAGMPMLINLDDMAALTLVTDEYTYADIIP